MIPWTLAISAMMLALAPAEPAPPERTHTDRAIDLSVTVGGTPSRVFEMWTSVEEVKRFFAPAARIDGRVDGRYEMIFDPESDPDGSSFGTKGAKILTYDRGKRLVFEWKGPPWATAMNVRPFPTWIEVTLEAVDGSRPETRVHLEHFGFGRGQEWDRSYDFFSRNWNLVLKRLKESCASRATGASDEDRGVAEKAGPDLQGVVVTAEARRNNRILRKEITLSAPVEQVWAAWTTSEGIASFFAPQSRIQLHIGGLYELYITPDAAEGSRGSEGCHVLSFIPREMLSFEWSAPPSIPTLRDAGVRTHVVLQFEELDRSHVHLRLSHLGMGWGEDWDRYHDYFDRAWDIVLKRLQGRFVPTSSSTISSEKLSEQETGTTNKRHWVYFIRPARPGFFEEPTEFENKKTNEHARYIKKLLDEGRLVLAGPCFDPPHYPEGVGDVVPFDMPTPGIVVFEAQSPEAARAIMENDPAVKAGVFMARLNGFTLAFHRD